MTWRTRWSASKSELATIEQILTEVIDPPVDATSLCREDDASSESDQGAWALYAYTSEPISGDVLGVLEPAHRHPDQEQLPDIDWVAHALEGLGVVRAGPFVLFGKHDASKVESTEGIHLQIEANQAFGTGHHPTTAGCLEALAESNLEPGAVLDIGTGSGVLAIAARKLFPSAKIVAGDVDAKSIEIARENAAVNNTPDIAFETASGTDGPLTIEGRPYDLVFANILAGPLTALAPDIAKVTAPGGTVILAGLLDEQMDSVLQAYEALSFKTSKTLGTARWPILVLCAPGGVS